ncbi:JAB domain-containing protein [soil metagenome]
MSIKNVSLKSKKKISTLNIQHIAEVELVYKTNVRPSDRQKVSSSRDTYEALIQTWNQDSLELCEEFKVVLLNRANRVLGLLNLSKGGVSGTVADPKLIFSAALKENASAIILAHNHPSGNLQPSQSDIDLTRKCKEAGRVLEIQVLDHIIVTTEKYYSFADEGVL